MRLGAYFLYQFDTGKSHESPFFFIVGGIFFIWCLLFALICNRLHAGLLMVVFVPPKSRQIHRSEVSSFILRTGFDSGFVLTGMLLAGKGARTLADGRTCVGECVTEYPES